MSSYSFLDVACSLNGPGVAVNLGSGAGVAEEGITFEMEGDKNTLTMGADGLGMNSLHAAQNGTVTIRLLKTSPANQTLQAAMNSQRLSATTWGQNVISLNQKAMGDVVTAKACAFKKNTGLTYAKDPGMNEWAFTSVAITQNLGAAA